MKIKSILAFFIAILFLTTPKTSILAAKLEEKNYFASLRANEVNVRAGPGLNYPIKFTFKLRSMPVKVIRRYDNWNEIRDFQGETGWLNRNLLTKKRTIIIKKTKKPVKLHSAATTRSKTLLLLEKYVVADLVGCNENWCKIKIDGKKGWIERKNIWGAG